MTTASTTTKVITFVVVGALWTSLLYAAHSQPRVTKAGVKPKTTVQRNTNNGGESTATVAVVGTAVIADPLASTTVSEPMTAAGGSVDPGISINTDQNSTGGGTGDGDGTNGVVPSGSPTIGPPTQNPPPVAITPTEITPIDQGVVWEAETAQGIKQEYLAFKAIKKTLPINADGNGGVSGNKWLLVDRKNVETDKIIPDIARYIINIPEAGTYYLWARSYWSSGCENSVFVNIDGVNKSSDENFILGTDGFYSSMHWVVLKDGGKMRPLQLKAGAVSFNLQVREPGIGIDQLLLTRDKGFVPDGIVQ